MGVGALRRKELPGPLEVYEGKGRTRCGDGPQQVELERGAKRALRPAACSPACRRFDRPLGQLDSLILRIDRTKGHIDDLFDAELSVQRNPSPPLLATILGIRHG